MKIETQTQTVLVITLTIAEQEKLANELFRLNNFFLEEFEILDDIYTALDDDAVTRAEEAAEGVEDEDIEDADLY